jgi:hypothetical protein
MASEVRLLVVGPYSAALIVLNLARGKDYSYVARVTFRTPEEVQEIERQFLAGDVEAIESYRGPGHA